MVRYGIEFHRWTCNLSCDDYVYVADCEECKPLVDGGLHAMLSATSAGAATTAVALTAAAIASTAALAVTLLVAVGLAKGMVDRLEAALAAAEQEDIAPLVGRCRMTQ